MLQFVICLSCVKQVYGPFFFSYKSFLLFCCQTDGSVPNTLVIANCEVVKPRVAAAEHISQVTHYYVMFLLYYIFSFLWNTLFSMRSCNTAKFCYHQFLYFPVQWRSTFTICKEVQDHHSSWRGMSRAFINCTYTFINLHKNKEEYLFLVLPFIESNLKACHCYFFANL